MFRIETLPRMTNPKICVCGNTSIKKTHAVQDLEGSGHIDDIFHYVVGILRYRVGQCGQGHIYRTEDVGMLHVGDVKTEVSLI